MRAEGIILRQMEEDEAGWNEAYKKVQENMHTHAHAHTCTPHIHTHTCTHDTCYLYLLAFLLYYLTTWKPDRGIDVYIWMSCESVRELEETPAYSSERSWPPEAPWPLRPLFC